MAAAISRPTFPLRPGALISQRPDRVSARWRRDGFVYLADDLTLGRQVALKRLSEERTRDDLAAVAGFQREARGLRPQPPVHRHDLF